MTDGRRTIRILFVTSLLDRPGGAEKNFCELALHIDRKRFTPYAIVFRGGFLSEHLSSRGILVRTNRVSKLFSLHALKEGLDTYRFLRREKIDVVVTYHHDADIWGGITAWVARVPVVVSSRRDMGYQLETKHLWFYRIFPFLFDAFITVSDAVKQRVESREWIPPEKVKTIHAGIVSSLYEREQDGHEVRRELGIDSTSIVVGAVASFRPVKRQMLIVEAVRDLVARHGNVRVVFVGDNRSDYYREIRARIDEWNLGDHFLFTGERHDIPRILSAIDVFVLSSESEGFSNAILEAMAAGKPVVAPDNGGNPEAVEHGRTGFLFVPGSSASLSEVLEILIGDKNKRDAMGSLAKRKASETFSRDGMIRKHEELFLSLVSGQRSLCGNPVPESPAGQSTAGEPASRKASH